MLAVKGEAALSRPALGGEYWGLLGKPGGEPLGAGDDDWAVGLGGVGVLVREGLELGLGLGGVLGELGLRAPDDVQFLPRNCDANLVLGTHSTLRYLTRFWITSALMVVVPHISPSWTHWTVVVTVPNTRI